MNITFMIGNGFDINVGLNTRYSDFYPYYKRKCGNDIISKDLTENEEKWADLELRLGAMLGSLDQKDIDIYLDAKENMEALLSQYLIGENKRFRITSVDEFKKEFKTKIPSFYELLSEKEKNHYYSVVKDTINYCFIDFNYTDVLDRMIETVKKDDEPFSHHVFGNRGYNDVIMPPLHIHGQLASDLVLGLNDESQITNEELAKDDNLRQYIIKKTVNERLGEMKTEQAKGLIDGSRYVCLFGLSIGDTDKMWWQYLIEWLKRDTTFRLVLFVRDSSINQASGQGKLRAMDKHVKRFISQSGNSPQQLGNVVNQILVVGNSDIFTFKSVQSVELLPTGRLF